MKTSYLVGGVALAVTGFVACGGGDTADDDNGAPGAGGYAAAGHAGSTPGDGATSGSGGTTSGSGGTTSGSAGTRSGGAGTSAAGAGAGGTSAEGQGGAGSPGAEGQGGGADGQGGSASGCHGALPDPNNAPDTVDVSCFTNAFDDSFQVYDISSGPLDDGMYPHERWFNGTDQCCMSPSGGVPGVNYPTPSQATGKPVNPYSLLPGGGLQISLQKHDNEWFSGVMTSVDGNGNGFKQAYGYFEMSARLPPGTGTWPAFWMLSEKGAPSGEIDIFEQYGCNPPLNPDVEREFHFTLHDWTNDKNSVGYLTPKLADLTAAYHRYGLLWNKTYTALYFDGKLVHSIPTLDVMKGPKYYLLADMGMGSGWDTSQTPNPSNMLIKYIRAYTVSGF